MTTGGGAALPSPGLAITVDRTNKSDSTRSDKLFILFQIPAGPGAKQVMIRALITIILKFQNKYFMPQLGGV